MQRRIITGLDVGTTSVQVVVADQKSEGGLEILGFGRALSEGMRRGNVVDTHDVASSIRRAVEDAERATGVPIEHAYVGFSGVGLGITATKGVVAVSRADGEISEADVDRVLANARAALPQLPNREVIHEIPSRYAVDKEMNIKNPVGMIGNRLEAQVLFISAFTPYLKTLVKSVELAGLAVDDIVASPLAAARAVLSKHQKEIGVMTLDLGGGSASISVFEEGGLVSTGVFPVGSAHVTHDIAIGFQTPLEVAERIKLEHGTLAAQSVGKRDTVRLADYIEGEATAISRRDLAEIIEARFKDIFELVDKHLKKIGRSGLLPSGVVFTGGGAGLPGIADFAKRELRLPAIVGTPVGISGSHENIQDPSWSVALGLCLLGYDETKTGSFKTASVWQKILKRVGDWARPFIP